MQNFAFPYFSRDIAEFWRRWHISLTTWFRDYLYIPLGGSRVNTWKKIRNTFIIFTVCGFWHGANWTFIFWGVLNAIYFLPLLLTNKNRAHLEIVAKGKLLPTSKEFISMLFTFSLTVFAWIFFRAENIGYALKYIFRILSSSIFTIPNFPGRRSALLTIFFILVFLLVEWQGREQQFAIQNFGISWKIPLRYAMYYAIIIAIFWLGGKQQTFIYFQF